ncbi:MAG: hypothetical protein JWP34_3631 [Massilia sp.]|nr:hypothetical protein [Massilia sp.]
MPKNKRPVPRKPATASEEDAEVMAQALADLAREVVQDVRGEDELERQVRNALRKKNDDVLYGAIESARYTDLDAWLLLRTKVEEAAATLTLRRDGKPAEEIDAFLVPMFVSSTGGLKPEETFHDDQAFEQLRASFQLAELESRAATVVLISHAYDLNEIDSISYSQLNDMLREAAATMNENKLVDTPALAASILGWTNGFDPDDEAMELRFLLGFSRKRADDPFYIPPEDEAEADAYFAARMERYRQWTVDVTPLVKSCLAADPSRIDVNFLYQDLFFGAKERAMAELAMLEVMADVNAVLTEHELDPSDANVIVAPAPVDDHLVLRISVYRKGYEGPLAMAEKPLDLAADLDAEVADVCDAIVTLGIQQVSVAAKFGPGGEPVDVRPYSAE